MVGAVACSTDQPGTASPKTIEVTWNANAGFFIPQDAEDMISTAYKSFGKDKSGILWVVGDGLSAPLFLRPETLAADQVYPDVKLPGKLATGTVATVFMVQGGKLGQAVTDIVITNAETPYVQIWTSKSKCYDYCTGGECGTWGSVCRRCSTCYNNGYANCGYVSSYSWNGASTTNTPQCGSTCGDCGGGGSHACWTQEVLQNCS
jgi:hypothetical protein